MRILFATSECVPFYKKGGLGDVSHALPIALSHLGVSVTVTFPYFEDVKVKRSDLTCLGPLAVDWAGKRELVFVFKTHIPKTHIPVLLFRHPRLSVYGLSTFLFFSLCISAWLRFSALTGNVFDIVHCNDWHTGLIPLLLGENDKTRRKQGATLQGAAAKTILTIHNLLYQGVVTASVIRNIGLPLSLFEKIPSPEGGVINIFREGLEHADIVSTVSPSYAREILTPEFGPHIFDALRRRHDRIIGILNGIDMDEWDPNHDPNLPKNYSERTVVIGKAVNKERLQKAVGLPVSDVLLFGFVGRIEPRQKGVDLIIDAVKRMPKKNFQVVFLGTGEKKQVKELTLLDTKEQHIAYVSTFDDRLARRIFGGSDVFLVPSKYEPCGLTQMIAMRYGTIPLVRKTGGLADSVEDGKTGFVFDEYHVEQLCKAMWKAITVREDDPKEWQAMIRRVMREDFSWGRSAKEYAAVYRKLASKACLPAGRGTP
jgi:starch synthase